MYRPVECGTTSARQTSNGCALVALSKPKCCGQGPPNLLLENFLDLPDLLFNLTSNVFGFALSP